MKASCPHCGAYGPVEMFLADADAKRACKEEQARYRPEPMARIRNDEMDAEKRRQAQLAGLAKFRARQGEL